MSLTFCLMLLTSLALSVVLLAALAIYWHAEAMARHEPMRRQLNEVELKPCPPRDAHMKLPLDADGEPIRIGDEMNIDGDAMTVLGYRLHDDMLLLVAEDKKSGLVFTPEPSRVRHFKPEPADSWERIAGDIEAAEGWCDRNGDYGTGIASISEQKLREWSDRIRKLAKKTGGDAHGNRSAD